MGNKVGQLALGVSLVALLVSANAGYAFAQAVDVTEGVEQVTVTGTSFQGVAPVGGNLVSVGRQTINETGAVTAEQMLKTVPAITGLGSAGITFNPGNSYYAPTIHSLGASASNSTLVLIDGHRIPLGHTSLTLPDPNMLPPIALERIEVLAEGASATYGSDAVAGVINFVTRKSYDGLEATAQAGTGANYGTFTGGLLGGTSWDRGGAYVAFGYSHTGAIRFDYASRPYLQPDHTAQGGQNFQSFQCSPATIQPNGQSGIYLSPTAGSPVANIKDNAPCDDRKYGKLYGDETRYNMMLRIHQDVTDRLTLSGDFVYSHRQTITPQARGGIQAKVYRTGPQANPFYVNPPGIQAGTPAGDSQTIRWDADELLGPGAYNNNSAPAWYGTANAEYRIDDNFRVTALFLYGQDRTSSVTVGSLCQSCAALALNGTTNTGGTLNTPVAGTNITVQQLPLTADNALDVWNGPGANRTSASVLSQLTDYRRSISQVSTIQQARLGVDGAIFNLPAGPVRLALGVESLIYGLDTEVVQPLNSGPASVGSSQRYFPLSRHVESAYGELLVPILSPENNGFVYKADLDISGRYDSYSDFGSTFNPKFAAEVEVVEGFKLRANWSRSFVAPSMRSVGDPLYGTYSNSTARAINSVATVSAARFPGVALIPGIPCSGGSCTIGNNIQGIVVDTGNPHVGPQKGETWSIGADISPALVPGFSASVTMFNNLIRGGITSPCAPGCILNNGGLNYLFSVYPGGATAAQIAAKVHDVPVVSAFPANVYYIFVRPQTNALDLDVNGLDISANYFLDTDFGRFSVRGSVTQFLRFKQSFAGGPSYSVLNTVGINSTFPSIARQARFNVGWDYDVFSVHIFANNVGGYKNWSSGSVNPVTLDGNGNPSGGGDYVKSFTTFDLHMSYNFSEGGALGNSQIYLDMNNMTDEAPPFYNTASGYGSYGANPLGRVISVGIRARW